MINGCSVFKPPPNRTSQVGIEANFFEEEVDKVELSKFYADPKKYAHSFQMSMLRSCLRTMALAKELASDGRHVVVTDRSMWGNAIFAGMQRDSGNISEEQWNEYVTTIKAAGPHS